MLASSPDASGCSSGYGGGGTRTLSRPVVTAKLRWSASRASLESRKARQSTRGDRQDDSSNNNNRRSKRMRVMVMTVLWLSEPAAFFDNKTCLLAPPPGAGASCAQQVARTVATELAGRRELAPASQVTCKSVGFKR